MPKRVVRLSFHQLLNAVRGLTDDANAEQLVNTYGSGSLAERTFPPLASPNEGSTISDRNWDIGDKFAADSGAYVAEHAESLTDCGAAPSADCVKRFVGAFAERAFRRPLLDVEQASLQQVVSNTLSLTGDPLQGLRYGVYAVFSAPQFLYRTELGTGGNAAGPLTANETADQVAYFLTDAPPDEALRDAAMQGRLRTREELSSQAARLLELPETRQNLEQALNAYLGLDRVRSVVIDGADFSPALRDAMTHESELFLQQQLWASPLEELLTSRRSRIDAGLASLYGVSPFPAPGVTLDADGFGVAELPPERAGLLTQASFLTSRSRPETASVVGRGLQVSGALLCDELPPFPEAISGELPPGKTPADLTERERADFRMSEMACRDCHREFDPYGLALDQFDRIGRFRSQDDQGRTIDPNVTLPASHGGARVASAVELAQTLAADEAFASCMAKSVLVYALADSAKIERDGCAVEDVLERFRESGGTFGDLVKEVAVSRTLAERF